MNFELKIIDSRITEDMLQPATPFSAAIDLRACIDAPMLIKPGEEVKIGSGIALYLKNTDTAALVLPRSGLGTKKGIVLGNLVGLIDPDYQGEIGITLWNRKSNMSDAFLLNPMDRIAQLIIVPIVRPTFNIVTEFSTDTVRGGGGFGSTGK